MSVRMTLAGILLGPIFNCSLALSQPAVPLVNDGDVIFDSVLDRNQGGIGEKLQNAAPAASRDWPASFYTRSGTAVGVVRCTSALIGPRVLLTAAHCVGNGRNVVLQFGGKKFSGRCTRHPKYSSDKGSDNSADYALCHMNEAVDVPYENLNRDAIDLAVGKRITLAGFGCTKSNVTGGNDGVYRVGQARISYLPGQVEKEENSIITRDKVALCLGDSGGPAFLENPVSGGRVVVGVNSRVWYSKFESYMSSVTTSSAQQWMRDWSKNDSTRTICGIGSKPKGCR